MEVGKLVTFPLPLPLAPISHRCKWDWQAFYKTDFRKTNVCILLLTCQRIKARLINWWGMFISEREKKTTISIGPASAQDWLDCRLHSTDPSLTEAIIQEGNPIFFLGLQLSSFFVTIQIFDRIGIQCIHACINSWNSSGLNTRVWFRSGRLLEIDWRMWVYPIKGKIKLYTIWSLILTMGSSSYYMIPVWITSKVVDMKKEQQEVHLIFHCKRGLPKGIRHGLTVTEYSNTFGW